MKRKMIMAEYLVFDWGGTALKYALMNEQAEILEKGEVPSPSRDASKEEFMDVIDGIVSPYQNRIKGIAISSPGIIDPVSGTINVVAVFPYLNGCCIAEEFAERYHVPVSLENDGKSAALAELWKGNLAGCTDGAVMLIGTGIGGGLIIDGKLHRGSHFSAGEFSLLDSNYQGFYLQNLWAIRGCTPNLVNSYATRVLADPATINGRVFFERLQNGDQTAKEVLDEFCTEFVNGIMTLQAVLDADRYCIGGGISQQTVLIETLNRKIDEIYAITGNAIPVIRPEIVACTFHNDANLIGALYHYLYELKQQ